MSIKVKKPEVKMNLYETDKDVLKSFITNEKIDGVFTEKYLILQNFAWMIVDFHQIFSRN